MPPRLSWLIWHPHEKLWNWSLVSAVRKASRGTWPGRLLIRVIVTLDSLLLLARVSQRRARLRHRLAPRGSSRSRVLYVDCGTHKEGEQIQRMHSWFSDDYELYSLGFEASRAHYDDARRNLAHIDKLRLLNIALVGPGQAQQVRLHHSGSDGRGDSLFGATGDSYEVVEASHLSEVLVREGWDPRVTPTILRMNIEGAEQYVIEDLVAVGLDQFIDGYYGMWDDVSKVDLAADDRMRTVLRERGIKNVTFNDRDLSHPLRLWAIRMDIETSIRLGVARTAVEEAQDTTQATSGCGSTAGSGRFLSQRFQPRQ